MIPSLREWHLKYAGGGLVVIGNHFPEFDYEKDLGNLGQALVSLGVPYAVVQDNDGINWQAYHTQFWPTLYLIDKTGHIRYVHVGEGNTAQTETALRALLAEPGP